MARRSIQRRSVSEPRDFKNRPARAVQSSGRNCRVMGSGSLPPRRSAYTMSAQRPRLKQWKPSSVCRDVARMAFWSAVSAISHFARKLRASSSARPPRGVLAQVVCPARVNLLPVQVVLTGDHGERKIKVGCHVANPLLAKLPVLGAQQSLVNILECVEEEHRADGPVHSRRKVLAHVLGQVSYQVFPDFLAGLRTQREQEVIPGFVGQKALEGGALDPCQQRGPEFANYESTHASAGDCLVEVLDNRRNQFPRRVRPGRPP